MTRNCMKSVPNFVRLVTIACVVLSAISMTFASGLEVNKAASIPADYYRLPGPQAVVTVPQELLDGNPSQVHLRLYDPPVEIGTFDLSGEAYTTVRLSGEGSIFVPGVPELPRVTRLIMIERTGNVELSVLNTSYTTQQLEHPVLPAQRDEALDNPERATLPDEAVYRQNAWYPEHIAEISEPATLRDVRFVILTTYPVQVNPATGQIRVYDDIEVSIDNIGGQGSNEIPFEPVSISPSFKKLYEHHFVNFRDSRLDDLPVLPGQQLFICKPSATVINQIQPIIDWRRSKGIDASYVTTTTCGGNDHTNIRNYIVNAYTNSGGQLEFVTLVGDPGSSDSDFDVATNTSTTYLDNYFGTMGDPYTDPVPDISVGRLPINSTSSLLGVPLKTVNYEVSPNLSSPSWLKRGYCIAHTGHAPSNVSSKEYTRQIMYQAGLDPVNFSVYDGAVDAGTMASYINAGVCVFNHRMSYIGECYTSDLSGIGCGEKHPFVMVITCGTGDFYSSGNDLSEEWINMGTDENPNGAIGCVGVATVSTATRYNSMLDAAVMQALFVLDVHDQGIMVINGKLEVYKNYWYYGFQAEVREYCGWTNLMGDPAVPIWVSAPMASTVTHPATVNRHTDNISVHVAVSSFPIEGALVGLWMGDDTFVRGYTDENGDVNLPVNLPNLGELNIAVTHKNLVPHVDVIDVVDASSSLSLYDVTVEDSDDGILNPGETADIDIELENTGTSAAVTGINAILSCDHPGVEIISGSSGYPNTSVGAHNSPTTPFEVSITAVRDGEAIPFFLDITSSAGSQTIRVDLTPEAAGVNFVSSTFSGGLDPGDTGDLTVTINNSGSKVLNNATALLRSLDSHITVNDENGTYGYVAVDANDTNSGDPFNITAGSQTAPGYQASMELVIIDNNGFRDSTNFMLTVGTASTTTPTGPDAYGYYAYDNTEIVPGGSASFYDWVEISGIGGTSLGFTDGGPDQDDYETVALPFDFTFYGLTYDEVTVCSNGWLAFGSYNMWDYRNWHIGSPLGPPNMVAAYWDDLVVDGPTSPGVYAWSDVSNGRFIVEWRVETRAGSSSDEIFEIILYDPAVYPSATGDGKILVQYNDVTTDQNNIYTDNDYATVGIQNINHTIGLEWCYWNIYTPGSATLVDERSIMFTTDPTGAIDADFGLSYPNGGEVWFVDSTATIGWVPGDVTGDVKLELSRNGASGPWTTIESATSNDGIHSFTISGLPSTTCRVRVSSIDFPAETDMSEADFTIATVQTVLYEDFESGAAGWTHSASGGWIDNWHISTEDAYHGTQSYKCGDTGTGTYDNLCDALLVSPTMTDLPEDATLVFYQKLETEISGSFPDSAYDGCMLEISVNSGGFAEIEPQSGYSHAFRYESGGGSPYTGPVAGAPCWAATVSGWTAINVDLSPYAGDNIQLRWRFGSDQGTAYEGWYIDDVLVFNITTMADPQQLTIQLIDDPTPQLMLRWLPDGWPYHQIYSSTDSDGPFDTFEGSTADDYYSISTIGSDPMFFIVVGWDGN